MLSELLFPSGKCRGFWLTVEWSPMTGFEADLLRLEKVTAYDDGISGHPLQKVIGHDH
jgi:hypothetical protein